MRPFDPATTVRALALVTVIAQPACGQRGGTNPLGELWEADLHNKAIIFPCDQFPLAHGRTAVSTAPVLDPGTDTIRVCFVDVMTDDVLFDELLQQERR